MLLKENICSPEWFTAPRFYKCILKWIKSKTNDCSVQLLSAVMLAASINTQVGTSPDFWQKSGKLLLGKAVLSRHYYYHASYLNQPSAKVQAVGKNPIRALLAKQNQSWTTLSDCAAALWSVGLSIRGWLKSQCQESTHLICSFLSFICGILLYSFGQHFQNLLASQFLFVLCGFGRLVGVRSRESQSCYET